MRGGEVQAREVARKVAANIVLHSLHSRYQTCTADTLHHYHRRHILHRCSRLHIRLYKRSQEMGGTVEGVLEGAVVSDGAKTAETAETVVGSARHCNEARNRRNRNRGDHSSRSPSLGHRHRTGR